MAEATGEMICPRCGTGDGSARFYGPCEACRTALRARFAGREVHTAAGPEAYEPKPNVTPNFVATKD